MCSHCIQTNDELRADLKHRMGISSPCQMMWFFQSVCYPCWRRIQTVLQVLPAERIEEVPLPKLAKTRHRERWEKFLCRIGKHARPYIYMNYTLDPCVDRVKCGRCGAVFYAGGGK